MKKTPGIVLFIFGIISNLIFAQNTWVQQANFGGPGRSEAIGFSIGTKGYIGSGRDGSSSFSDFWEWDQSNNIWTQKANCPGPSRIHAAGFSIGTKGYIGIGWNGSSEYGDFWEYDPIANNWSPKANFPGVARYAAVSFSMGTKGYITTGRSQTSGNVFNDLWEWNQATNTWTQKANLPGVARYRASGFAIGTKGYVGTGVDASTTNPLSDFWEWDQTSNTWIQRASYPVTEGSTTGFSIAGRGYIGTGGSLSQNLYEWSQTSDSWVLRANLPAAGRSDAVGFAIGNRGYIGAGYTGSYVNDFWEYTPLLLADITAFSNVTCNGGNNGSASVTAYNGLPPYSYSWSPSGGTNSTAIGLSAGTYTVTVTDVNTAATSTTVTISQPAAPNAWAAVNPFGGTSRYGGVAFSIGSKGYYGTGIDAGGNTQDFWEYNSVDASWTQKANYGGGPRHYSLGFSIGSRGYIGAGENNSGNATNDFWEYNPATNSWVQKANISGTGRTGGIGFSIGGYGYAGLGTSPAYQSDIYEYNPLTNIWNPRTSFPGGGRAGTSAFSVGTKAYLGFGYDGSNYQQDFYEFDQLTNSWTQKPNLPGGVRSAGVGFAINGRGYFGTGDGGSGLTNDLWEWNPGNNSWTAMAFFPGAIRYFSSAFVIGNYGYVGAGLGTSLSFNDFYKYSPPLYINTLSQSNVSCNGGNNGSVSIQPVNGCTPYTYSWSPSGGTTSIASNLSAGIYTVTVSDAAGATTTSTFTITQPIPNTWVQKANLINSGINFSIGTKGYAGTSFSTVDFWEYDPTTNIWTQKANFGGVPRGEPAFFSIGNKGYAGTGFNGIMLNDFWEYDPSTNIWTQKANFIGSPRFRAVGLSIGNLGYIGMGDPGSPTFSNDFYEYNPAINQWSQKASLGTITQGRIFATGFSIGSKGYVGLGTNNNGTASVDDFWEFDPAVNQWTQKQNYGGGLRHSAAGYSIGSKGYVGAGDQVGGPSFQDFWEYDPITNSWTLRANVPAGGGAFGFSISARGYIGIGSNFWEYSPIIGTTSTGFTNSISGQTVTFTNTSQNATNYYWNFGDGNNSSLANPVHIYNYAGTYNVCLTASTACSSTTVCQPVTIGCTSPVAAFSNIINGLTVNFTNASTNAASVLWDFGDGNDTSSFNASHTFFASGTYNVCLIVENGCGADTLCQNVTVSCTAPTASYFFNTTGMQVTFTNTSPNAATSLWYFGDSQTSISNSPTHMYANPGTYNVKVVVTNDCGLDSLTQAVVINCATPTANFMTASNGNVLQYVSTSSNSTSWLWDFGDMNTSILPNGTHNYLSTGTYNVCLVATNGCGSDSICDSVTVCTSPTSNFTSSSSSLVATFTNTSVNGTTYMWTFGDAYASNQSSPVHTYPTAGSYNACLIAENVCGSDTLCDTVNVVCTQFTGQSICLVTVDSLSNYNVLAWDKPVTNDIAGFVIYREITSSFVAIDTVPYTNYSVYKDSIVTPLPNPNASDRRYKIALIDTCFMESAQSIHHRTIFLQSNIGVGPVINLNWVQYEGASVIQYYIYRDTTGSGAFQLYDSVPGANSVYTDNFPPSTITTVRYVLGVQWGVTCNPSLRGNPSDHTLAAINNTKSNIKSQPFNPFTVEELLLEQSIILVPNPTDGFVSLQMSQSLPDLEIVVYNNVGQVVFEHSITSGEQNVSYDFRRFASGLYTIAVRSKAAVVYKKLVIQ